MRTMSLCSCAATVVFVQEHSDESALEEALEAEIADAEAEDKSSFTRSAQSRFEFCNS